LALGFSFLKLLGWNSKLTFDSLLSRASIGTELNMMHCNTGKNDLKRQERIFFQLLILNNLLLRLFHHLTNDQSQFFPLVFHPAFPSSKIKLFFEGKYLSKNEIRATFFRITENFE